MLFGEGDIQRAATRRFSPWKNGGGETAEIVVHPAGAGFADFDWRISTAKVVQSGPFSRFDGIDRSLTVLQGGPIRLRFEDGRDVDLAQGDPALVFAGDLGCAADLIGEALLDLNVMVRRPLRCRVDTVPQPVGPDLRARYVLALAPFAGLERLDLVEIDPAMSVDGPALWIDILG
ncbi:MAG TPA: HutD family protein [Paenirhodobacter sp.]